MKSLDKLKELTYLDWLYPTNLFVNRDQVIENAAYKRRLDYDSACFMWDSATKLVSDKDLEIDKLKELNAELIKSLEKIANQDYRGNRSTESVIAYNTLVNAKKTTELE